MHDIRLAMARNYSENLREEVKKGMSEKASQGTYPGRAPFGYRNNKAARSIEIHPEKGAIAQARVRTLRFGALFTLVALQRIATCVGHVHLENQPAQDAHKPFLHRAIRIGAATRTGARSPFSSVPNCMHRHSQSWTVTINRSTASMTLHSEECSRAHMTIAL